MPKLPEVCRPIPFPVVYGENDKDATARSPLPDGSSSFLKQLAAEVEDWGKAFDSRDEKKLKEHTLLDGAD